MLGNVSLLAHVSRTVGRCFVDEPPTKLSFIWEPEAGKTLFGAGHSCVSATLVSIAQTEWTLQHQGLPNDDLCHEHENGWHACLHRLAKPLATEAAPEPMWRSARTFISVLIPAGAGYR